MIVFDKGQTLELDEVTEVSVITCFDPETRREYLSIQIFFEEGVEKEVKIYHLDSAEVVPFSLQRS